MMVILASPHRILTYEKAVHPSITPTGTRSTTDRHSVNSPEKPDQVTLTDVDCSCGSAEAGLP